MPPGYDGLVQDNPYKAPQTQPPPQGSQWANQSADVKTSQNITGNGNSGGSGMSSSDWAAIAGILSEYFGKDNKTNFRNVPLSPEQQELYKRALGYLDNSPTRNYLMPQIDQRLRALGSTEFKMPQTIGAKGLPPGMAGQTFYQPGSNRTAPMGGTPPLGPLVTPPPTGAPPTQRPNPDDREQPDPRSEVDRGGQVMHFFDTIRPEYLQHYEQVARANPETAAAIQQAGGFSGWWASIQNAMVDYINANPNNISGLLTLGATLMGGPLWSIAGQKLADRIKSWAKNSQYNNNRPGAGNRPDGPDREPGAGGPLGGYGGDVGPGANTGGRAPGAAGGGGGTSVDTTGNYGGYYDPTTGKFTPYK